MKKDKDNKIKKDKSAIQTLFRTISKNHYALLAMIDRKANIILTINSIIISIILGASYLAPEDQKTDIELMTTITIYFSLVSMILAILAIRPHQYKDPQSMLYSGTFTKSSQKEFKESFKIMMESGESIYENMIDDLYCLGQSIKNRQKLVFYSITTFVLGIITNLLLSFLYL